MVKKRYYDNANPLKILFIGNSFSTDSAEYLFDISQSSGIDILVGISFDSGIGLKQTWNKLQSSQKITAYQKWSSKNKREEKRGYLLENIIHDENWDIVIFQQVSSSSNKPATFYPYLVYLKKYVENHIDNKSLKFGLNMTWAFSHKSSKINNMGYKDQSSLFNAISNTYQQVMAEMNFEFLIPTGTAIQNARTTPHLKTVGDDLTRDGSHLDKGIGRYIASLTVFETLNCNYYNNISLENVSFFPNNDVGEPNILLEDLSKLAAKNAVLQPFRITPM